MKLIEYRQDYEDLFPSGLAQIPFFYSIEHNTKMNLFVNAKALGILKD